MLSNRDVVDFKAEVLTGGSGLDVLRLSIEPYRAIDPKQATDSVRDDVARSFQVTPEVIVLEPGVIGKEFETSVKAGRFLDRRG
jgi:hypothetical protein